MEASWADLHVAEDQVLQEIPMVELRHASVRLQLVQIPLREHASTLHEPPHLCCKKVQALDTQASTLQNVLLG